MTRELMADATGVSAVGDDPVGAPHPGPPASAGRRVWLWMLLALLLHGTVWVATVGPRGAAEWWPPARWLRQSVLFHHPAIVPNPGLYDARVLLWGAERRREGLDPLAPQLLGDAGVNYNYPSGWAILSWLGLRMSDRLALGWFMAVTFSVVLAWLLPPSRGSVLLWHAAILLSPAGLNTLGEGNGELLVLALVAVALQLARRPGVAAGAAAALCLAGAALLKLYPLAGFAALALSPGRRRWLALAAGLAAGSVLLAQAAEIRAVIERTPRASVNGFGCAMLPARAQLVAQLPPPWLGRHPRLAAAVRVTARAEPCFRALFGLVVVAGLWGGWRSAGHGTAGYDVAAALGMILFLGTFGLGNSWYHRLLVPVLCLAAFYYRERRWASLGWIVASLWTAVATGLGHEAWFIAEQAMFWALLAVVASQLGRQLRAASGVP